MQKINRFIANNGLWIFLGAAVYKLTFYIISLVNAFKPVGYGFDAKVDVGYGMRTLFSGLLGAIWDLIILAVLLEVSKKIASGYPPEVRAPQPQAPQAPASPYTAPMPAQQPVQPAQPAPAQPVQPAPAQPTAAIWTCPNCGSQNTEGMAFCAKCGTKR